MKFAEALKGLGPIFVVTRNTFETEVTQFPGDVVVYFYVCESFLYRLRVA